MSRPVHIRRLRSRRRIFTPPGGTRADRTQHVRVLCGAWVPPCEAMVQRGERSLERVTCAACREVRS